LSRKPWILSQGLAGEKDVVGSLGKWCTGGAHADVSSPDRTGSPGQSRTDIG